MRSLVQYAWEMLHEKGNSIIHQRQFFWMLLATFIASIDSRWLCFMGHVKAFKSRRYMCNLWICLIGRCFETLGKRDSDMAQNVLAIARDGEIMRDTQLGLSISTIIYDEGNRCKLLSSLLSWVVATTAAADILPGLYFNSSHCPSLF